MDIRWGGRSGATRVTVSEDSRAGGGAVWKDSADRWPCPCTYQRFVEFQWVLGLDAMMMINLRYRAE